MFLKCAIEGVDFVFQIDNMTKMWSKSLSGCAIQDPDLFTWIDGVAEAYSGVWLLEIAVEYANWRFLLNS